MTRDVRAFESFIRLTYWVGWVEGVLLLGAVGVAAILTGGVAGWLVGIGFIAGAVATAVLATTRRRWLKNYGADDDPQMRGSDAASRDAPRA
jgi:hypothetical protein